MTGKLCLRNMLQKKNTAFGYNMQSIKMLMIKKVGSPPLKCSSLIMCLFTKSFCSVATPFRQPFYFVIFCQAIVGVASTISAQNFAKR